MDYDETSQGDAATMKTLQNQINGVKHLTKLPDEYSPSIDPEARIILKDGRRFPVENIILGDDLSTGSKVVGVILKEVKEVSKIPQGRYLGAATLVWHNSSHSWKRAKEIWGSHNLGVAKVFRSFICTPNSQLELATDPPIRIRDYLEVCSPDSEIEYSNALSGGLPSASPEIIVK
jgi:hypothetical protein